MASFVSLLFTTQKNGFKGDSTGTNETGDPQACAVAVIRRRVVHLRQNGVSICTSLVAVYKNGKRYTIKITDITKALREAVKIAGSQVGFKPTNVSVCSM